MIYNALVLSTLLVSIALPLHALNGQVVDESTTQGLSNAIVQVKPSGVMRLTGADGRFDLSSTSLRQTLGTPQGAWQVTRQGRRLTFGARKAFGSVTVEVVSLSGQGARPRIPRKPSRGQDPLGVVPGPASVWPFASAPVREVQPFATTGRRYAGVTQSLS